ncbi:CLUMA_CG019703, isoform A [Clunio marinus]|uniref:CLUMA_CG019703, isoform A n=1 Tax=Clunio marinus TaxID=568069 RepID=A0A1J1J7A0_9DIPT|nr:CLUMA_CG019703, isoform A [Clunio marinus]
MHGLKLIIRTSHKLAQWHTPYTQKTFINYNVNLNLTHSILLLAFQFSYAMNSKERSSLITGEITKHKFLCAGNINEVTVHEIRINSCNMILGKK